MPADPDPDGPDLQPVRRLRVLFSAYACGPGDEPEANAGWAFATAAAVHHDVWVITRPRFRAGIDARLAEDATLAQHLTIGYLDLPGRVRAFKRHSWDLYWYYPLWQFALTRRARALHARIDFDVIHHVTFANDWMPCGAAYVSGPAFVWGPVGGASRLPVTSLARWLGVRGTATEVLRIVSTAVPRRIWGDGAARRAALVAAQNPDVATRFRASAARVVVEPNAAFDEPAHPGAARGDGPPMAVFAARLLAWKGGRLAVEAMAHPLLADWRLDVYGTGYEEHALRSKVRTLGMADRVHFLGHRPREQLLAALASADALLFPSMHDQAGWVAAEASAMGCPVVCLPLGGPPVLAGPNARVVSLDGDLVENLAVELDRAKRERGIPHRRWTADRLPSLLKVWYAEATARGSNP